MDVSTSPEETAQSAIFSHMGVLGQTTRSAASPSTNEDILLASNEARAMGPSRFFSESRVQLRLNESRPASCQCIARSSAHWSQFPVSRLKRDMLFLSETGMRGAAHDYSLNASRAISLQRCSESQVICCARDDRIWRVRNAASSGAAARDGTLVYRSALLGTIGARWRGRR